MDIEIIKKIIKDNKEMHADFVDKCRLGKRYYENKSDIFLDKPQIASDPNNVDSKVLRNADNRIANDFFELLVNQKTSYAFGVPPVFDVGDDGHNEFITKKLGDNYNSNCARLCVNASCCSVAWIHYWKNDKAEFKYGIVDSEQIIPIYNSSLEGSLQAVIRLYTDTVEEQLYEVIEYWDNEYCYSFRKAINKNGVDIGILEENFTFTDPDTMEDVNFYKHEFSEVPFCEFSNNLIKTSDLNKVKRLIDVYDKVYSGFINDLDDIQEIIFILSGYQGEDLNEFLAQLRKYKTIKVNDDGDAKSAGLSTLNIEIPIEARDKVLELTRKAIFQYGEGFDPQPESFGNRSGEALKFMYALLEMKVSFMETEFRTGFAKLIRAICESDGFSPDKIIQTWTRNRIKNDLELSQICQNSVGIVSQRTLLANHPFVQDAEAELEQINKEKQDLQDNANLYEQQPFNINGDDNA